jgi:sRNA-binding protein
MGGTVGIFEDTPAQKASKEAAKEQERLDAEKAQQQRKEEEKMREEQARLLASSGRTAGGGVSRMTPNDKLG